MKFCPISLLHVEVELGGARLQVGRLAWRDRVAYFEYDPAKPQAKGRKPEAAGKGCRRRGSGAFGRTIARPGPWVARRVASRPFEGLHGLFNDCLPDGWVRLLMDRKLHQIGLHPSQLTPLDRLAWIGARGGALAYRPEHPPLAQDGDPMIDLDKLAEIGMGGHGRSPMIAWYRSTCSSHQGPPSCRRDGRLAVSGLLAG